MDGDQGRDESFILSSRISLLLAEVPLEDWGAICHTGMITALAHLIVGTSGIDDPAQLVRRVQLAQSSLAGLVDALVQDIRAGVIEMPPGPRHEPEVRERRGG